MAVLETEMVFRSKGELGAEVERLRSEVGMSQRELAEHLDIDPSALSRAEGGERGFPVQELAVIADLFGVTIDSLLRNEDAAFALRAEDGAGDAVNDAVAMFNQVVDDYFAFQTAAR